MNLRGVFVALLVLALVGGGFRWITGDTPPAVYYVFTVLLVGVVVFDFAWDYSIKKNGKKIIDVLFRSSSPLTSMQIIDRTGVQYPNAALRALVADRAVEEFGDTNITQSELDLRGGRERNRYRLTEAFREWLSQSRIVVPIVKSEGEVSTREWLVRFVAHSRKIPLDQVTDDLVLSQYEIRSALIAATFQFRQGFGGSYDTPTTVGELAQLLDKQR